jgi:hypothetical protein
MLGRSSMKDQMQCDKAFNHRWNHIPATELDLYRNIIKQIEVSRGEPENAD